MGLSNNLEKIKELPEFSDNIVEQKGLGEVVKEFKSLLGDVREYLEYARLITNRNGGYNVQIMDNPFLKPQKREFCLFPEMVSEEEARRKYNELH